MDKQTKTIFIAILAGLMLLGGYFLFFRTISREIGSDDNNQADKLSKEEKQKNKEANQQSTDESVKRDDCENGCARFKDDQEKFQNCQQICGLNQAQDTEDCPTVNGSEKDLCLKKLATKQFNYALCNVIQSPTIKEECKGDVSKELFYTDSDDFED